MQVAMRSSGWRRACAWPQPRPASYARLLASEQLAQETGLRVTQLGAGVVIRTAPKAKDRLPVVVGYADVRGQWHRDGHRHIEARETKAPSEAAEVEL